MRYILWQVVCLLCYSGMTCAQSLQPKDFVRMLKSGAEQIDSLAKAKGFKKVPAPQVNAMTGIAYVYQGIENDVKVQRLLLAGWHQHPDYVECEYDVWQQKDALDWTNQLLKAGYTKTVLSSPDTQGKPPMTVSVFRKNNNSIYCEEQMDADSGRARYKFTTTSRNYKGGAL
jgi:hypothetical protein